MGSPNVEGTSNPDVVDGGVFGAIVGSADGAVGFYGSAGVAKQSSSGVTTVAELIVLLQNLGLVS
jgi:hypothetical protein